jgi:hypothetical protein
MAEIWYFGHKLYIGTPYRGKCFLTREKCAYMFNVYKNQLSRQTGSRNLTGPKTLPTLWHTYMKLVTKYQIPVIKSCWEKVCHIVGSVFGPVRFLLPICRLSWFLYTLNIHVYAHLSSHFSQQLLIDTPALWQTGSRNLTAQKTLPTIWGTYMKLVTKY